MRLLNTTSITLHEFNDMNLPSYAILSHRWEEEEIGFSDMVAGHREMTLGYQKVLNFCTQALADGFTYCVC